MKQGALKGARGARKLSVAFILKIFTVSSKKTINEERLKVLIVTMMVGKPDRPMSLDQCMTCVIRDFTQTNPGRL